jgi:hypothetical protein
MISYDRTGTFSARLPIQKQLKNIQGFQGKFREHSGNIQGTFKEHSGNIQGTFRDFREHLVTNI